MEPPVDADVAQALASVQDAEGQLLSALDAGLPTPPEVVFHYTDVAGLLGILTSRSLWATDFTFLSDASEGQYGRTLFCSALRDVSANRPELRGVFDDVDALLHPGMVAGDHFVSSFCEDGDLLSQWRGYSGGVGGYAIGFFSAELQQQRLALPHECSGAAFFKVLYDRDTQSALLAEYATRLATIAAEGFALLGPQHVRIPYSEVRNSIARVAPRCLLGMKSGVFAEEREWRLCVARPYTLVAGPHFTGVNFRVSGSLAVPYITVGLLPMADITANQLPVARIVVGPSKEPDLALRGALHAAQSVAPIVSVYHSAIPLR